MVNNKTVEMGNLAIKVLSNSPVDENGKKGFTSIEKDEITRELKYYLDVSGDKRNTNLNDCVKVKT